MKQDDKFTYYGIATTSLYWQLIELNDKGVKTSKTIVGHFPDAPGPADKKQISHVIAHLINVLNKCKKDYDDAVGTVTK
jgi:Holliday junction resolvasome RuvABC endonuclease subunit